jgi:transcriptional regulator with XRE-family HTH domain
MASRKANNSAERDGNLGESLRRIRKERGLTLIEAGEKTGMPMSTISKIENNKMSLSYDKLLRLCKALEVDISQLFTGTPMAGKPASPHPAAAAVSTGMALATRSTRRTTRTCILPPTC